MDPDLAVVTEDERVGAAHGGRRGDLDAPAPLRDVGDVPDGP
ncbi:hypothetical protein ABZ614_25585 [Streptomyces sp. NPDC013178]